MILNNIPLREARIDWDEELRNCSSSKDYNDLVKEYVGFYFKKNLDNNAIDILTSWVKTFGTFGYLAKGQNPMMDLVKNLSNKNINFNGNDLITLNNLYASNEIGNEDLTNGNPVLFNKSFYGKKYDEQVFWLEMYDFFSDKKNVNRVANVLGIKLNESLIKEATKYQQRELDWENRLNTETPLTSVVLFGKEYDKSSLTTKDLQNIIMFDEEGNLRNPKDIENFVKDVASAETSKKKDNKEAPQETSSKNRKRVSDYAKVRRNLDDLKDKLPEDEFIDLINAIQNEEV